MKYVLRVNIRLMEENHYRYTDLIDQELEVSANELNTLGLASLGLAQSVESMIDYVIDNADLHVATDDED